MYIYTTIDVQMYNITRYHLHKYNYKQGEFKRIDYLFNNAGIQGDFTQLHDYDVADFRKIMEVNVTGTFIVLKAVANQMKNQNRQGGAIVNTASMAAHSGMLEIYTFLNVACMFLFYTK